MLNFMINYTCLISSHICWNKLISAILTYPWLKNFEPLPIIPLNAFQIFFCLFQISKTEFHSLGYPGRGNIPHEMCHQHQRCSTPKFKWTIKTTQFSTPKSPVAQNLAQSYVVQTNYWHKLWPTHILCLSLSCLRRSSRWERPVQWTGAGAFLYTISIRGAIQKKSIFLGISPKCRTPLPPFWEPLVSKPQKW